MYAHSSSAESVLLRLKGRQVSEVMVDGSTRLSIQFLDGAVLVVSAGPEGLAVRLTSAPPESRDGSQRPTRRQSEYLAFISKYIQRFGRAPAEADIQRHFLVSAPSVNQMMQMLERRGFITRQPGIPRSTRVCLDVSALNGD
jgi:hypothetical protein